MLAANEAFKDMGYYLVPLIIIIIELIVGAVLLGAAMTLKRRKRVEISKATAIDFAMGSTGKKQFTLLVLHPEDKRLLYISKNFEDVLGVDADRLSTDIGLMSGLADNPKQDNIYEVYVSWDGKEPLYRDFFSKTQRWIRLSVTRDIDSNRDFLLFFDITDIKQEYDELDERLKEAENRSQYKTNFLSKMSHEIRTPMNGIIGMLSLAENQCKDDKVMQYLVKADELSQYLLSIMNDVLDLSRIEAGKLELEQKPFDIMALANKIKTMFQKTVEAKGVRFELTMTDFDVRYLVGDELRLSQVLANFLSNSVKFTHEGEITVAFKQMLKNDGKVDIMIKVHDTGIGMEPEFLQRIFKPFEQENTGITRKYGGTGLGMAITDSIVHSMGGTIVIDSFPNKGSDFNVFLTLPIADGLEEEAPSTHTSAPAKEDFTYKGKNILLAEDNEINAEIAVSILELEGATIDVAKNGIEAVDMFASSKKGQYDFILMDVQMPELSGWDAAKQIRELPRDDAREIYIFALSADAFVEDKRHSLSVGMDGHFAKPINFDEMRKEIDRIMKKGR